MISISSNNTCKVMRISRMSKFCYISSNYCLQINNNEALSIQQLQLLLYVFQYVN
uniref:Candidate secreted effector n=1 Tax=Meloidogyne incognita TaxID=6306 RepID=A0A914NVF3_MELIC